jgi:hypothetical protein
VFEFFRRSVEKISNFAKNLTRATATLHEYISIVIITSRQIVLGVRNFSDKIFRENQNTFYVQWLFCFFSPKIVPFLIMWINIVEPGTPQMTIWRMGIACWVTKATNTNPECNTYCFSTTTVVTRTRFIVTSYVHCLTFKWMILHIKFLPYKHILYPNEFHCFTVNFNSLYLMVQLMHLFVIKLFVIQMSHIKTLKITPTCFDHQLIIIREMFEPFLVWRGMPTVFRKPLHTRQHVKRMNGKHTTQ